ncbi:hypothetical protein GX830_00705 [Candidatus Dojkabacteria bacterium]|jgi:hypothetical protein|nr:hypothetical protein [Candidatus Dojkabacteria bacterium]
MSKLLKRALKISLTPAILMVAGKFLGILIPTLMFDIEFAVQNEMIGISSIQILYPNSATTLFINSISNLVMLVLIAVPTIYLIIKTSLYQSTLQNPRTIVKITKLNILNWITKKNSSFLQIFIWSSFLLVTASIIIVHTIQNMTYTWIGVSSGVMAFFCIWGTIRTFELEIAKIYPEEKNYY